MSIAELTRNSFQGGISAEKWLDLCKLLVAKSPEQGKDEIATNLSNSILILFRTYPGSPALKSYLQHVIRHSPYLPTPTFISTFLQAARSTDLHVPSTLRVLLSVALEAYYSGGSESGQPILGSVVAVGESPSSILRVVGDALALLRTVCSLPPSASVHPHPPETPPQAQTQDLITSTSELLILLLACVPADLSRVPTAQAISLYGEMSETMMMVVYNNNHSQSQHQFLQQQGIRRLDDSLMGVLETFLVSLSLLIGESGDGRAGAGAGGIMNLGMHDVQPAAVVVSPHGKADISSADMEAITLGLVFNHMVTHTAHSFGAGDTLNAVALLLAVFRSSSWSSSSTSLPSFHPGSAGTLWTPAAFNAQILVVALECLMVVCQSRHAASSGVVRLWKGFVVGRLPALLASLVNVVSKDNSTTVDMRKGSQDAVLTVFRRQDIFLQVDHALSVALPRETAAAAGSLTENHNAADDDGNSTSRPISRELLHQLVKYKLITHDFASQLDPHFSNDVLPKWYGETLSGDTGIIDNSKPKEGLMVFLESKLMHDVLPTLEVKVWIERIWNDPGSHSIFAGIVAKRFTSAMASMDVDILGPTCKILHTYDHALEMVALHTKMYDLIFYSLLFLEEYDCEVVGDPQTAVSHLGDVVLFVQYALVKFKFENNEFTKNNIAVSSSLIADVETYLRSHARSQEDEATYHMWNKALFDSNSEGIEDNTLRATKPKNLLRAASTLIADATTYERDVMMNGISYFTSPLLNWVLVGVIKQLVKDVLQDKYTVTPAHYEILQTLILSPSCPRSVLVLCSPYIAMLVSDRRRQTLAAYSVSNSFNVAAVRRAVSEATGVEESYFASGPQPQVWYQQAQQAIQAAFSMARSQHKTPPFLDLRRCLNLVPPIKFLQILWSEIRAAANMGELEACRRIATFALTTPLMEEKSTAHHYPLLPIFLHVVLPGIIAEADLLPTPEEQTLRVDLLVAILSSVLNTAMHLEWALRSVSGPDQPASAATAPVPPQAVPVLGQTSSGMARRLAVDLRRNRMSQVSKQILHRLAASHPFVSNFPVFKSELSTT